jgi:hypothetical protein
MELVKLSQKGGLDIWQAIATLHDSKFSGVLDFVCNQFYNFSDEEIEIFIPQLW